MSEQIINSQQSLDAYKKYLDAQFEKHKYLRVDLKNGMQRTKTQNAALHKFCEQLAVTLNDGGFEFTTFVKHGYEVPFTKELVKDHLWRPVQEAVTGKLSTTKPETHEYAIIYDALNSVLAKKGIYVPWPSVESKGEAA